MQRAVHLKLLRWLDKQQTTYWQSSTSCLTFRCVMSLVQILASASILFKDYSSWVYQRNCPPWRLNSVLYGLKLTLTIPRKFRLKAWRCVSNSLLVPRQVSRNSSSVIRKIIARVKIHMCFFPWTNCTEIEDMEAACCSTSCQLALFPVA